MGGGGLRRRPVAGVVWGGGSAGAAVLAPGRSTARRSLGCPTGSGWEFLWARLLCGIPLPVVWSGGDFYMVFSELLGRALTALGLWAQPGAD